MNQSPSRSATDFLAELEWRGLLAEESEGLRARLARGPISAYIGFDASARSLHVGNLLQVFLLSHLQRAGGTPFVVVGGATGMIGDPSGKSSERNLLDDETIAANSAAIRTQLERFLDFTPGPAQAQMVNNRDWLGEYRLLDFLRDVGKHFSVPYMLAKESVKLRLDSGMSFTEFSYMTLQSADFLHLLRARGVEMQMGGADQWGNITAGLELIRRVMGRAEGEEPPAYALCSPLLLTRSGQKMGKSERGAVFLDPRLTSPYEFYQYWLNDDDQLAGRHLRWLTLMTPDEVYALEEEQQRSAERRRAQRALAFDLTARIHGREEAERQVRVAEAAFGGVPIRDPDVLEVLFAELGGFEFGDAELADGVLGLAVAGGLYPSRGEARRQIAQGGLSINDERVTDPAAPLPDPIAGKYLFLRAGKKRLLIGRRRH
ncbi:MAG TPA: tyrosine--tRNA ligase [Candidatus Limnocylindria bacterium]|nr:tyrosine--tRNA ligase [Candidatus Limnocylindria bacterium]